MCENKVYFGTHGTHVSAGFLLCVYVYACRVSSGENYSYQICLCSHSIVVSPI